MGKVPVPYFLYGGRIYENLDFFSKNFCQILIMFQIMYQFYIFNVPIYKKNYTSFEKNILGDIEKEGNVLIKQ